LDYLKSPKPGAPSHLLLLAKDNIFGPPIGAWFTLMEDDNHLVRGFGLVSFQFFQKCPNIDLKFTACLSEIEM
jgi:hypothetical protein